MHPYLSDEDQDRIIDAIRSFVAGEPDRRSRRSSQRDAPRRPVATRARRSTSRRGLTAGSEFVLAFGHRRGNGDDTERSRRWCVQATARGIVSGTRVVTAEQREAQSRRIAGGLANLGIRQGDSVALLMRNDISFLEVALGAAMLGAYSVPINWHFKSDEIAWILRDCAAKALIGHSDLLRQLDRSSLPASMKLLSVTPPPELIDAYGLDPDIPVEDALDFGRWIDGQEPYLEPPLPAPQSMMYTSGTTGRPKGVRRDAPTPEQHRKTEHQRAVVYGVKPGARALLPGPLYHAAPNSFGIRAALVAELLVLMPRFEPETVLRMIEIEHIDTVFMVPTMFVRLLQLSPEVRRRHDLSSLRHVIHAAAPCPPAVKAAMIEWWGPVICEFYGGTEMSIATFATSADSLRKPGTVGRCAPGSELRICDDCGHIVGAGHVGEIFARCDGYPDFTYHNAPDKRAEVERDGFITGGDIGYVDDDGYLFICDRNSMRPRHEDGLAKSGARRRPALAVGQRLAVERAWSCRRRRAARRRRPPCPIPWCGRSADRGRPRRSATRQNFSDEPTETISAAPKSRM